MALKMKLGATAYNALPEDVKKEYKAAGSDFVLDLEGYEDPAEIKRAKDNEVKEHGKTKRELAEAKDKVATLEKDTPDVTKELDKLRTELTEKHNGELTAANGVAETLKSRFQTTEANRIANEIATKISSSPKLLVRDIADRVLVEFDKDNNPTTFFKGVDGKRSAMTAADIEKEFSTNKDYAAIIIGTKGSGGVRDPKSLNPGRAGNFPPSSDDKPQDLSKIDPRDLAAMIAERKDNAGS